jgi:UDP-2,3-diacylglucosamine hydrolase
MHGSKVLLSHGDVMCTDDVEYQSARTMTRNPEWQSMMLAKPLAERQAFAAQARAASRERGKTLSDDIADVNQGAVEQMFRQHAVRTMLHGHTHRPAVHRFELDGEEVTRIVLGDWYDQGSVVRWDDSGPVLSAMAR